ncbi:MAG TPA: serine/threonine-protein kinase [Gemmatimonadales bacterium]|jgi:serine/threonine-protein kinase
MNTDKLCPMCGATYGPDHVFCPRDRTALRAIEETDGLIGTVIGQRYLVTERIGAGGMGEVFKAQDVRLPRVVAVKVMRPHLAGDPDAIARVIREAANGSQIRNQYVVDISDYGETDTGRPYLAMEFIPGESLRALMDREGSLEPRRAVALLLQMAAGLDAAHRLGIVHRDMKPDNVIVYTGDDGDERIKLVDFGISRAVRDESQHLTKTGFITGTCEFMSPEQVAGRSFDHHTDIYSLGLVAFKTLTGSLPFMGDTPELAMLARLHEPPRRLDEMSPAASWSPATQNAIDRALSRDPAQRFDSAGDFARALAASVNEETPATRSVIVRRKVPWKVTAAAAAAALLIVAVVASPKRQAVSKEPALKVIPTPIGPVAQESGEAPSPPPSPVEVPSKHDAAVGGEADPQKQTQVKQRKTEVPLPAPAPGPIVHPPAADIDSYRDRLQPGIDADSARRVIASLEAILPRLTSRRDSVEADIYRAEGYALAGEAEKACAILDAAMPRANTLQRQKMELWVDQGLCKPPEWKSS